ncbi:MAG: hypothetical protein DRI90_13415 [Deltaproteobacteria bacterium]|nr:MAG: hypothetical protein DRI90_13415 [Deltaproteobacteria bacterium]
MRVKRDSRAEHRAIEHRVSSHRVIESRAHRAIESRAHRAPSSELRDPSSIVCSRSGSEG